MDGTSEFDVSTSSKMLRTIMHEFLLFLFGKLIKVTPDKDSAE